jgi:hypothetical protein
LIVLVCLSAAAIAQKAPPSKPFERFDGCVLEPDEWTDGDSFRVRGCPTAAWKLFVCILWTPPNHAHAANAPMSKRPTSDYLEIIADNLSKAGWSWGCVSAIDSNGRTIWIADAHRDNGNRFVVHADEKLTAFLELEWEITQAKSSILLESP